MEIKLVDAVGIDYLRKIDPELTDKERREKRMLVPDWLGSDPKTWSAAIFHRYHKKT